MKIVALSLTVAALVLLALATAQACPYHEKTSLLTTNTGQEQPQGQSPVLSNDDDEQRLVDVPTPATDGAN